MAASIGIAFMQAGSTAFATENLFELSIPRSSVAQALKHLARETGYSVIFQSDEVKSVQTNSIEGRYSVEDALDLLFERTELSYGFTEGGVISIIRAAETEKSAVEGNMLNAEGKSGVRRLLTGVSSLAAAAFSASAAGAQEETGQDAQGAASQGLQLSDSIVVTANRREENLQDVAASVAVVDADAFTSIGLTTLEDVFAYTPGASAVDRGAPGQGSLTLRGIPQSGSTPTSSVYLNDVPLSSNTAFGGGGVNLFDGLLGDIERVEVVKGPQGTLYGAVSVGGLVKYVTRKPSLDGFRGTAGVQVSNTKEGGWNQLYNARMSAPIVRDKVGLTVAGFYEDLSGYVDQINPATGEILQEDADFSDRFGVSGDLLFAFSDQTSLRLAAQYQDTGFENTSLVFLRSVDSDAPLFGPFSTINGPGDTSQVFQTYSGTFEHDFDWVSLTSVSSYAKYETTGSNDATATFTAPTGPGGAPLADFLLGRPNGTTTEVTAIQIGGSEKFSQEVRLTSASNEKFEWVAGFYFTDENTTAIQDGPTVPAGSLISVNFPSEYQEFAGFGSGTYYLTPDLDLTGGVRVSRTSIQFTFSQAGPLLGLGADPVLEEFEKISETVPTFSAALRYRPQDNLSLYGRVASGYRPASTNIPIINPVTMEQIAGPFLESDRILSYEIGAKGGLFEDLLYYEFVLWRSRYDDFQTLTSVFGLSTEANFDDSLTSQGIEGSFQANPFDGLELIGNFTYTDSALDDSDPDLGAVAGERHPGVPEWTGAGRAAYSFPLTQSVEASIGGGFRYVGETVAGFVRRTDGGQSVVDGYVLADLDVSLTLNERANIRFFVNNVFNEIAIEGRTDSLQGPSQAVFTTPRTIGVSLSADF